MNLFKNIVNKLFDKDQEAILNDCIAFDESGLVFTVFVRNDLPRERVKFMFQEYVRQKQWFVRHTGAASMTAYQIEPDKRTMQAKIGFTGDKEKIMQISWSSPNPASVYLFRDLTMEFVDLLSSQNMLKLQTNPMPALTAPIELKDFLEEQLKPVELMDPDEALVKLSAANAENQGIPQDKRALAEHVVFEEDDEDGSHVFRVVCRLNKDAKTAYAISVLSNVANGLDCTSFAITKTNVSATVKVVMRTGTLLDLVMTVGLNESKHRILHGTYPESQAAYGRQFWMRFAESLAKLGLLFGQTISPSVILTPVPASAQTANSSLPQFVQKEEDLADDSGLEYDSSDYDEDAKSEASVDSDSD